MKLIFLSIRMRSYHLLLFAAMLSLVVLGIGCGEDATPAVITDSAGNQVVFDDPPQRIVAYDSAVVEILYAMGEGDRIVGTHDFVTYPPESADIPKVGGAFNINSEQIVVLEPDLIYTFYAGSLADLENLGAKVLYLEEPEQVAEIPERIRLWGRILRNEEAAEQVAKEFEAKLKGLEDRVTSVDVGPRLFHDDSDLFTRGPDTLLGRVYSLLKAQNIAEGGYGQLSPEVLVDRDPEVIITTFPGGLPAFTDPPALQGVSAVRNGRVHAVDAAVSSISVAGPRFVEAMEELSRLIHPELY